MKRMIAMIIVLSLLCGLLAACGDDPSTTQSETELAQAEPQTSQTEATTTQTEPEPTQTEPAPEIVYNYSPVYTRLSDEPITALQPSEDYGCILPFQGEWADTIVCGNSYANNGFMDANGRIIVDPVYQLAEPLTVEDGYDFEGCVWLLGQGEVADMDMSGYHFYLENARYGLAEGDGSVVVDLMYDEICVLGNLIFAKKYTDESQETYDVDIYNFDCALVGSIPNLQCDLKGFAEDVLLVTIDTEYYYMDMSGKIFAGPYLMAENFSCGYGLVELLEKGGYGIEYNYVDKNGKLLSEDGWLITPEGGEPYQCTGFSHAESFVNGVASVEIVNMWEQYSVLTTENEFLFDFRIFDKYQCTEEYILNSALGGTEIYNHDGELLRSYPELELQRMTSTRAPLLYDSWNNKIYNWKTGESFDGFEGMIVDWDLYATDFPYYAFIDEEKAECVLTDENMNILCRIDQYTNKFRDALTGNYYVRDYTDDGIRLTIPHLGVDINTQTEGLSAYDVVVYNDFIMCLDGGACRYYNSDLELVFCYPFG